MAESQLLTRHARSVPELAQVLQITVRTARRDVYALAAAGLVERIEFDRYMRRRPAAVASMLGVALASAVLGTAVTHAINDGSSSPAPASAVNSVVAQHFAVLRSRATGGDSPYASESQKQVAELERTRASLAPARHSGPTSRRSLRRRVGSASGLTTSES